MMWSSLVSSSGKRSLSWELGAIGFIPFGMSRAEPGPGMALCCCCSLSPCSQYHRVECKAVRVGLGLGKPPPPNKKNGRVGQSVEFLRPTLLGEHVHLQEMRIGLSTEQCFQISFFRGLFGCPGHQCKYTLSRSGQNPSLFNMLALAHSEFFTQGVPSAAPNGLWWYPGHITQPWAPGFGLTWQEV